jgi:hypothetical protein
VPLRRGENALQGGSGAFDDVTGAWARQRDVARDTDCRQNLVGSLPRGMPNIVDCRQTGVQATNEMVMQNNTRVYLGQAAMWA